MTYIEQDGKVVLTLTREEYERLTLALAHATAAAVKEKDVERVNDWLKLVNRINEGNPEFRPYRTGE